MTSTSAYKSSPLDRSRIQPANAPVRGDENKENLLGDKNNQQRRLHRFLTLPLQPMVDPSSSSEFALPYAQKHLDIADIVRDGRKTG